MIDAVAIPIRTTRDHLVRDLVSLIVSEAGLSPQAEADLRRALHARIDPILDLSDAAVASRAELEAVDRRLDLHTQTHRLCALNPDGGCRAWNDLRRTREQLQRRADREMRALWGGSRR